jgi:arsenite methyltransferase
MASLTDFAAGTTSSCCAPERQLRCCDPSEKAGCCLPESSSCSCLAGQSGGEEIRAAVRGGYAGSAIARARKPS